MPQWRFNDLDTPNPKTIDNALSVFEKVFRDDALKKEAAKKPPDQSAKKAERGVLKHIFGIFN